MDEHTFYLTESGVLSWWRELGNLGSTTLVEGRGFDSVEETVGVYKVHAQAAMYLADIVRLNFSCSNNEPSREILFSGGVAVFREGQIRGTGIQGYSYIHRGDIWVAKAVPKEPTEYGLRQLLFADLEGDDRIARVEAIIEDCQRQTESTARAEAAARGRSFQEGRRRERVVY